VLNASGVAVSEFETLGGLLVRRNVMSVFLMRLAILFAGICLLVALAGIYSHFLQWVRRRDRELGIRLALGAGRARVGGTVVSAAAAPVLVGLTAGIALARLGFVFLRPVTEGAIDGQWAVIAIAASGVGLAALLMVCVPAVLASRRNPLVLLRSE
jgi:ABC-type antimicrobial peptide transport system permease subunit